MNDRKQNLFAVAVIVGFLVFRILYIATTGYDLSDDEAYFWDWSRHPALSYYDQGPMVAWIIKLFTLTFSLSPFSVRIGAPIFMALTGLVIYFLARDIMKSTGGRLGEAQSAGMALLVLLLFHLTPLGAAGGIIMTYYAPQVLFMALVALLLWQIVKNGDGRWWYPIGVCLGLGLLSHHMFLFFTAEVVLFILLSQKNRHWLKRKEPYLALFLMLLTASPLIIWNLNHNMVMFRHALGMMSRPQQIAQPLKELMQYIGGQAGVQTPLFFLAVIWGLCVSGYRGLKLKSDKYLLLFSLSAPVLFFVALLSLGGRSEANWPASGYITGAIAAVCVLAEKYRTGQRPTRTIIKTSLALTLIICVLASAIAYYPSLAPRVGIKITPENDPANRLYGWKALGEEVSEVLKDMPAGTFVAASGYGQAGELAFYVTNQPEVFELPTGRRFSQYDFWNKNMDVAGKDAVFADYRPMSEKAKSLFGRVEPENSLIIRDQKNGLIRHQFYIYRCYDYQPPLDSLFRF